MHATKNIYKKTPENPLKGPSSVIEPSMLNYYKHFPPSHRRGQTTIQSCNSCNSQTLTTVFLSTCCSVMDVLQLAHRALIRYSARLILAWEPVMVTCLSVEPSTGLAILI